MIDVNAHYGGLELVVPSLRALPYPAISGRPGWQTARCQASGDRGPIVEGSYTAKIEIDPLGARFKRALDGDGLPCKLVPSSQIQEILIRWQRFDRAPGQSRLMIQDCGASIAAWGRYRWRLVPDARTRRAIAGYGRTGGFHVHGGGNTALGTSGCIRVGDEFWSDLRAFAEKHAKTARTMRLRVEYASRDTRTGPMGDVR